MEKNEKKSNNPKNSKNKVTYSKKNSYQVNSRNHSSSMTKKKTNNVENSSIEKKTKSNSRNSNSFKKQTNNVKSNFCNNSTVKKTTNTYKNNSDNVKKQPSINKNSSSNNKKTTNINKNSKNTKSQIKNISSKALNIINQNTNNIESNYNKKQPKEGNIIVKRKKLKVKNLIILIIAFIAFIMFSISITNIIRWSIDNRNISKQINKINKIVKIETVKDTDNTVIIENVEPTKSDPYWDYIKMKLIDVNFDELLKINKDTKGWLQVNGTNVNYPFVQTSDNDYYLNHAFDKSYNGGGWVFLDYRNNINNNDKNTIIYGHGRQNKTIFGTLKDTLNNEWLNNTENHIIKLSTNQENSLWQIFSVYRIPTTNDYIQVHFNSDNEYLDFLNKMMDRSIYNFNTTISKNDRILTLSTCYNDNDKVVIHAKLIKKEQKN